MLESENKMGIQNQNYGRAYRLAERVFRLNRSELIKFYKRLGVEFDLYPAFCNRVFWEFCLPKIEYGQQVKDAVDVSRSERGITRYQRYTRFSLKRLLHSQVSLFRFIVWGMYAILCNRKEMIFVEGFILDDQRYKLLHESLATVDQTKFLRVLDQNSSPYLYLPLPHWSLLRLLKNKCVENVGAYSLWKLAIYFLKPSKVIILDDSSYKTYSLVLAAKVSGVDVVALSHGQLPPNQPFAYGFKGYLAARPLLFDRFYVWDALFQKAMRESGLYDQQIHVCGWLQSLYDSIDYSKSKKKYVLHAVEHFTSNRKKVTKLLKKLSELHGYQVIVKARPQDKKESNDLDPSICFVEQFTSEHIRHAFCAVGTGSSMMYELSSCGIPLLSPEFSPDYDFNLGMEIPFMSYSLSDIQKGRYKVFYKSEISQKLIGEFIV